MRAALLAIAALAAACESTEEDVQRAFLILTLSNTQPPADSGRVIVAAHARGGTALELRTQGGVHVAPSSTATQSVSCVDISGPATAPEGAIVLPEGAVRFFTVLPSESGAVVEATLFSRFGTEDNCEGIALRARVLAIARGDRPSRDAGGPDSGVVDGGQSVDVDGGVSLRDGGGSTRDGGATATRDGGADAARDGGT